MLPLPFLQENIIMYPSGQPTFQNEGAAHDYLERWLSPWFRLAHEVILKHPSGHRLRIDFLATPEPETDFPFDLFGIEVKSNVDGIGLFNQALKQGIDYTFCTIDDSRERLAPVRGCNLTRAYIFPGPAGCHNWWGGSERLAGKFHVGVIYSNKNGKPKFCMSADRQWDADYGPRAIPIHTTSRVGSGVIKRVA